VAPCCKFTLPPSRRRAARRRCTPEPPPTSSSSALGCKRSSVSSRSRCAARSPLRAAPRTRPRPHRRGRASRCSPSPRGCAGRRTRRSAPTGRRAAATASPQSSPPQPALAHARDRPLASRTAGRPPARPPAAARRGRVANQATEAAPPATGQPVAARERSTQRPNRPARVDAENGPLSPVAVCRGNAAPFRLSPVARPSRSASSSTNSGRTRLVTIPPESALVCAAVTAKILTVTTRRHGGGREHLSERVLYYGDNPDVLRRYVGDEID
jgi:hypothetical protein